MNKKKKKDSN